jgi:transposase
MRLTEPKLPRLSVLSRCDFISMEHSCTSWLLTSLSPGGGERMSKHTVRSGDVAGLRARFPGQGAGEDRAARSDHRYPGSGSRATSRRRRRAKTDKIDGKSVVRALLAYKRAVCAIGSSTDSTRGGSPPRLP